VPHPDAGRFLTIPQVAEELATSEAQISALVKRGDLVAIKIGGRGQWRIERTKLEDFIARAYEETERELHERREAGDEDE
jgi:excisionase family DNA binding protein